MPRVSAGLLMYRIHDSKLHVLLAHPGGPFFKNKDDGAWSIPKGEIEQGEDLLDAAKREFEEETGVTPTGPFTAMMPVKQKGGRLWKRVRSRNGRMAFSNVSEHETEILKITGIDRLWLICASRQEAMEAIQR
jgi:predicted NUDIX family NTP pyrophosphohydrolase